MLIAFKIRPLQRHGGVVRRSWWWIRKQKDQKERVKCGWWMWLGWGLDEIFKHSWQQICQGTGDVGCKGTYSSWMCCIEEKRSLGGFWRIHLVDHRGWDGAWWFTEGFACNVYTRGNWVLRHSSQQISTQDLTRKTLRCFESDPLRTAPWATNAASFFCWTSSVGPFQVYRVCILLYYYKCVLGSSFSQ